MGKQPSFQFYPADWLTDAKLQSCSLEAQGLLVNLMCLMHQSEKYGFLLINNEKKSKKIVAKLLKISKIKLKKLLKELKINGVLKESDEGIIYCERMVKDQRLREVRRACGKLGGNPNLVNPLVQRCKKQKLTPSSSSSYTKKKQTKKKETPDFYPDWLDVGLWFDFIKYRKTIKAPMTERAEKILLTALEKLIKTNQGTQQEIIEQTIASGKWKGLFPVRIREYSNPIKSYKPPKMPSEKERISSETIKKFRKEGLK